MKSNLKIVFMGTPEFAVPSLLEINKVHNVVRVYTQPPKPSGRGLKKKITPVHKHAMENKIKVAFPEDLNNTKEFLELNSLKPDFIIVVAYSIILPKSVIKVPKYFSLNGHASKLPRWRGAAPIHRAIEAGDKKTAVEAMIMEETLDTGSIVSSKSVKISNIDNYETLHNKLSKNMPHILLNAIELIINDQHKLRKQSKIGVTYAKKISSSEKFLVWNESYEFIENKLRAFTPWPGIWINHKNNQLRIHSIKKTRFKKRFLNFKAGQIVEFSENKYPIIITIDNVAFEIKEIQRQGGIRMNALEFTKGYSLSVGDYLNS